MGKIGGKCKKWQKNGDKSGKIWGKSWINSKPGPEMMGVWQNLGDFHLVWFLWNSDWKSGKSWELFSSRDHRSELAGSVDEVEERDIVDDLVAIIPGVEHPLAGVVVQHGDVRVLVVEGDVRVLVTRSVRGIREINLGAGQVRIGDVENPANHERLAGAPFGIARIPTPENLQGLGIHPAHHDVPGVLVGRINNPKSVFVHHEVDVGEATPGVGEGVVVTGAREAPLDQDAAGSEMVADGDVALEFVVVQGAVEDHVASAGPRVREEVLDKVLARDEVGEAAEFQHTAAFVVAVHVPHLWGGTWGQIRFKLVELGLKLLKVASKSPFEMGSKPPQGGINTSSS